MHYKDKNRAKEEAKGLISLPGEIWDFVPGYSDYMVSSKGRAANCPYGVWRLARLMWIGGGGKNCKYLGFRVKVARNKYKYIRIHTVVAELFIGPRPPGMLVCHKEDDRNKNSVDDLYYGTHGDNIRDWWRIRTAKYGF
jgi:hypothetical protein